MPGPLRSRPRPELNDELTIERVGHAEQGVDTRRPAAALEASDRGLCRAAELGELLLREVACMTLLDDLVGDGREKPALLGFASDTVAEPLETAARRLVLLPHSLEAIIACRLCQGRDDLAVLREAAFLLLREDQVPVGDDVELTLLARNDLGFMRGALVQLGRETRSPAVIAVSDGAVEDLDPHVPEPTEVRGWSREIQASSPVL